jgi:hypothetical protein
LFCSVFGDFSRDKGQGTGAMDAVFPPPSKYRIVVVSDVDLNAVNAFAEKFVPTSHDFDMVILSGPLTHRSCESVEDVSVLKADVAAIVAQWETVVCRVAFLGSDSDPTELLTEQMHLTPNSVNIHARYLPLARGMYLAGYAETRGNLIESTSAGGGERLEDEDDSLSSITRAHGETEGVSHLTNSSIDIIGEILDGVRRADTAEAYQAHGDAVPPVAASAAGYHEAAAGAETETEAERKEAAGAEEVEEKEERDSGPGLGLFCLNYKYAFTLNSFLFHIPEQLQAAGVRVAIISSPHLLPSQSAAVGSPGQLSQQRPSRVPVKIGNMHIVQCGSLRDGAFAVLTVALDEDSQWVVESVEYQTL